MRGVGRAACCRLRSELRLPGFAGGGSGWTWERGPSCSSAPFAFHGPFLLLLQALGSPECLSWCLSLIPALCPTQCVRGPGGPGRPPGRCGRWGCQPPEGRESLGCLSACPGTARWKTWARLGPGVCVTEDPRAGPATPNGLPEDPSSVILACQLSCCGWTGHPGRMALLLRGEEGGTVGSQEQCP